MSIQPRQDHRYRPLCSLGFKYNEIIRSIPDLLAHQRTCYEDFLQMNVPSADRAPKGLHGLFLKSFPVKGKNATGHFVLEYIGYELRKPVCSISQAYRRRMSYAAPLHVKFQLSVFDLSGKICTSIAEESICFGNIPITTNSGTFIFNGVERTVVSQTQRSSGMFFEYSRVKGIDDHHGYSGRIVPAKGAWIDLESDSKNLLFIRIDKRRKILASTLLLALDNDQTWEGRKNESLDPRTAQGYSKEELLSKFYQPFKCVRSKSRWRMKYSYYMWKNLPLPYDLYNTDSTLFAEQGTKVSPNDLVDEIEVQEEALYHMFLAKNLYNEQGELLTEAASKITQEMLDGQNEIEILELKEYDAGAAMCLTFGAEQCKSQSEALLSIVQTLRPGENVSQTTAESFIREMFFNPLKYDLSETGRIKLNERTRSNREGNVLHREDLIDLVRLFLDLRRGQETFDEADSLEHKRIRLASELLEGHCKQTIVKIAVASRERIASLVSSESEKAMPSAILHSKSLMIAIKEFFGLSQLSQLMDQANILSGISHQRRISAMGQGGVTKDHAGFEVRDVHNTYYGKICPLETPEGITVGLISALSVHARINHFGFLETQYRVVKNRQLTDEIVYCTTSQERGHYIAHFKASNDGVITDDIVTCRYENEIIKASADLITLIDVSPFQQMSVAASMIPFVEKNDTSRALMGANMQRQALPLVKAEAPLVCTGIESVVAYDSSTVVKSINAGTIRYIDHRMIVIEPDDKALENDVYELIKHSKSNACTFVHQRAIKYLRPGSHVSQGDVIADSTSTDSGEAALGKNILVAIMPWYGYNFEDAVAISSRLVQEEVFTSVHVDHFDAIAQGEEIFTRDIPNVSEEMLAKLDNNGIVQVGTEIKTGDILVGKVAPRPEVDLMPEERLLKSIFGDKTSDVYDISLKVPPGVEGVVTDVQILSRRGYMTEKEITDCVAKEQEEFISMHQVVLKYWAQRVQVTLPKSGKVGTTTWEKIAHSDLFEVLASDLQHAALDPIREEYKSLKDYHDNRLIEITRAYKASSEELLPIISKSVRVFVTSKRRIQAGDKIAGRHGNKCVVSTVVPMSDMPYMDDGTPVDIVLTSCGLPSRMNLGQIYECIAGMASRGISQKIESHLELMKELSGELYEIALHKLRLILQEVYDDVKEMTDEDILVRAQYAAEEGVAILATPFCSPSNEQLEKLLELGGINSKDCQFDLYDGRSGEKFRNKVTVGVMYITRLNHDVDDKVHARSVGPYGLVNQQPLSGRAQFGGQRVGEMEVWALQAAGAAYTLLEILTVKSDDTQGRMQAFDAFVRGGDRFYTNTPESFKLFCLYARALNINISVREAQNDSTIPPMLSDYSISPRTPDITVAFNLASPNDIRSWSYGEIESSETHCHRNDRPVSKGLFCAQIFGPVNNYECNCGRYKRMKYKGIVCEKCKVEVTHSKVRRERMGHITLAAPVTHVWFSYVLPSRISLLLDINLRTLSSIVGCEMYVITNPGESNYAYRQLISAREYDQLQNSLCDETGDLTDLDITAQTGGEAIETLLKSINLEEETIFLKQALSESGSELKRKKISKKLELIKGLLKTGTKPEWMVIRVLPILPPATRPMINIENGYGRAGTIGLNELYKSVLTRNERLRRFRSMNAPLDITRNEIRALQQAVDSVIDNGRNGSPALDSNGVEYRSIGRYWKGKDSLCRQRLLGKRVDYSGRSVIVVGPHLRLDQCALPRRMALQLYQPFVLSKLESYGFAATLKSARKMIEQEDPVVWDILQEVIRNRPVILNRQPTLHRLGMQAFNPILTHGKAIQINPLVCSAFNADFDGDQMAVHLPLSVEARLEAHTILLSTRNLLSAAHGNPVIAPSQDIVLGIYYMTHTHDKAPKIDRVYSDFYEVKAAIELNKISLQSKIRFYYNEEIVDTTPGRVLLHREMPASMSLHEVNKTFKKSDVSQLLYSVYKNFGEKEMVILADAIKTIGFYWATHSGISVGKSDFLELKTLSAHIKNANDFVHSYQKQCHDGLITANELSSKTIDTWTECVTNISADLMKEIAEPTERGLNHLYMMLYSGARGSKTQLAQMLGARGLITKSTQNKIIETPIENNYCKGLSAHEVFISAFGTRKGTADTALKTSNAGYLTRRIVTACQSCVVTEYDCGTSEGLQVQAHIDEITNKPDITDMVFGKVLAHDIVSPTSGEVLFAKGTLLQEDECMVLRDAGVHTASVRSPIKCNSSISMCAKCYGLDLAKRKLVTLGEAVGIIAAQSIGEPGAQLTMNTFHIGGIAQHAASKSSISTIARCKVSYIGKSVINTHDETIIVARNAELIMTSETGIEISRTRLPYGAKVSVSDEITEANTIVAQWDAYNNVIIADHKGKIILHDIVEGISLQKEIDELTGNTVNTITDWRYYGGKSLHPRIAIEAEDGKSYIFNLTPDTLLEVEGGQMVEVGHVLGKIPKESLVSKDITAGLPKVAELLEARNTKCASIADDDGYIEQDNSRRVSNKITLIASEGRKFEYTVPNDAIALVRDGDFVRKGDQLTSGELGPSDLLRVLGVDAVANYLIKEVQNVYQVQGAKINNKHIEVIVHQMLQKYLVIDAGDSDLGDDSYVSRVEIHRLNESLIEQGLKPIKYQAVVMGITSAAVHGSTLSSVAFQNSIKTLVRVSITAGVDTKVDSPQDCVLAAQLMKAGTGYACRAIKNNQSHAINKPPAPDQND